MHSVRPTSPMTDRRSTTPAGRIGSALFVPGDDERKLAKAIGAGAALVIADEDGLRRECELARSLGFGGKACIHPRQVPVVERAFAPAPAELEWARRVVDAYEAARRTGAGVVRVDGAMVDLPVYGRALDIAGDERAR